MPSFSLESTAPRLRYSMLLTRAMRLATPVLAGQQAGEDVDLVLVGDRHDGIGLLDPGLLHALGAGPVALDGKHVQLVLGGVDASRVTVEQGDFVPFEGEACTDEAADLAGAHH
jgi:hypothetical protein